MKKKFVLLTASLCVALLTFYACKKEGDQSSQPKSQIEAAKQYFTSEVLQKQQTGVEANRFSFELETDWQNASVEKLQSFEVVTVPLKFKQTITVSKDGGKTMQPINVRPFLSIFKDKKGEMRAEVVYKFLDEKRTGKAFSGNILVTDWEGNVNRGYRYKDGKAGKLDVSIGYKSNKLKTERGICVTTDYYQEVYRDGEMIGRTYLRSETVCSIDQEFPGEGGGTGGGSEPDYSGGGGGAGGAGTGTGNIILYDIINNLQSPCLINSVHAVNNGVLKNTVSTILCRIFDQPDNFNIRFYEASLADSIDGDTKPFTNSSGTSISYNMDITLNSKLVTQFHSSQEYIVATILHEVLHAYFSAKNYNPIVDHNEMGLFYIDKMSAALREIFPSLSDEDATALAWGGVHESYSWSELVRNAPLKAIDILNKNKSYKTSDLGTKCN
ncbi:hypothetical protein [Chitinophaga vietnamensis]|uniref:hypothetical protein n=1 Tax=Chitinophaga vietnamensis TaxID=2593957 RepID=UPI0011784AAC|nr:hypothetical protein [Chitinophaga vietnamensis]